MDFFSFSRLWSVIPKLLPTLTVTLQIIVVAVVAGTLLGILVAVLRIRKIPVIHQILGVYISFMRGTPMLAQLMLMYYGLPLLIDHITGIDINNWNKIIFVELTFVLNEGAFMGEIFRGAIESVPYEQTEAAYSVGLNSFQTFRRIILPQAIRVALPGYGVDVVSIFHNTSIAFMIGVIDIIGRAKTIGVASGHIIEAYVFIMILYVVVSILMQLAFKKINRRLQYGNAA